jgi:hypothetical protein
MVIVGISYVVFYRASAYFEGVSETSKRFYEIVKWFN